MSRRINYTFICKNEWKILVRSKIQLIEIDINRVAIRMATILFDKSSEQRLFLVTMHSLTEESDNPTSRLLPQM